MMMTPMKHLPPESNPMFQTKESKLLKLTLMMKKLKMLKKKKEALRKKSLLATLLFQPQKTQLEGDSLSMVLL